MTVGGHDPADLPESRWIDLRPIVYDRLRHPRVAAVVNRTGYFVDQSYQIPYVAGISVNLDGMFVDHLCPISRAPVGPGGAPRDLTPFVWLHESGEHGFMTVFGDHYLKAHDYITIAEHDAVVGAGINWARYCNFFDSCDRRDEVERIIRSPRTLYTQPYRDTGDYLLLQRIIDTMV